MMALGREDSMEIEHEMALNPKYIKKALIAKELLFNVEGMDADTLYQMNRVIDLGIAVVTEHLNKKYKLKYPCSPWDFVGMTEEEYGRFL